ncbi:MAG: toxic anion resistance protein, partial [Oscillospiraceae bacterium]|nr:toxic anion resistance protein [Oscillospiraceae bacterium]
MNENQNMMPELTLNADAAQVAAPQLVLGNEVEAAPVEEEKKIEPVKIDDSMLTEAERKMVDDFSQKIDIKDSQMVLQYGSAAQKNVAAFSESALSSVRTKDLGEVGDALGDLVVELKDFGEEEEKGFFGFFKKAGNKLETMKAQFSSAEANVEKIARN